MAQLTPEDCGMTPIIGKFYFLSIVGIDKAKKM